MLGRLIRGVQSIFSKEPSRMVKEPKVISARSHKINPKSVSWQAKQTCERLQARGYKGLIVGGAVRDLLVDAKPKDFDVATDATPEQVKRVQRRAFIIGRRFKLVHVVFGQEIIECSTFRALEGKGVRKDGMGRVISDNVFGEMWEDAARRDFTINALYYDPVTENLYDYHDGFEDLSRGVVRMIGDPEERYREDPVRMLRAVRIASKLGFTIEPSTQKPIKKMAKLLRNVPSARLVDELMKLLTCGHAVDAIKKMRELDLHLALLPILDVMLREPEDEAFMMLAMLRTDERIAIGKGISPTFLLGTLLWPQVYRRWRYKEEEQGLGHAEALHLAALDVLQTMSSQLQIQRRYQEEMYDLWRMQLRFEKRTGKHPWSLIRHQKYRKGYDFMLLCSQAGQVDPQQVQWWEAFAEGDEDARHALIEKAQQEARETPPVKKKASARARAEFPEAEVGTAKPKARRRYRKPRHRKPNAASSAA